MTVGEVIERIKGWSAVPFELERTCDILAFGSYEAEVTGIASTFMATADVIRAAGEAGINLIITHEPTYFSGMDTTDWLEGDPVYDAKVALMRQYSMNIWRYHDHMHMKHPDPIYVGIVERLGWQAYAQQGAPPKHMAGGDFAKSFTDYYDIPETTLEGLAAEFSQKLGLAGTRIVGKPGMPVRRVGILVGGGSLGLGREEMPAEVMRAHDIDVLVCGDITEWTLAAYVNDAVQLGFNRGMLVVGHERTEEWGMEYFTGVLQELCPGLPVQFLDAGEPFRYL